MTFTVNLPRAASLMAMRRAQVLSPERRRQIAAMGWKARRKKFSRAQLSEQMKRTALVRWAKRKGAKTQHD
jgi:hypothetical protein